MPRISIVIPYRPAMMSADPRCKKSRSDLPIPFGLESVRYLEDPAILTNRVLLFKVRNSLDQITFSYWIDADKRSYYQKDGWHKF